MSDLGEEFDRESEAKATPICPHCGAAMTRQSAFLCGPVARATMPLPPYCTSEECRAAQDETALADAITRGVIDP